MHTGWRYGGTVSTSDRTAVVSSAIGSNRKTLVLRWTVLVGGLLVERQASSGALTVYERITDAFMAVLTWPPHTYGYITRSHNPLWSKQIVKLGFGFTDLAQCTESNTESQPLGDDNQFPSVLPTPEWGPIVMRRVIEISREAPTRGKGCTPVPGPRKSTITR